MIIGLVLVILGLVLLFVPIPHQVRHGVTAGPLSVGVTTTEHERMSPLICGLLIAGGVVLMVVSGRKAS